MGFLQTELLEAVCIHKGKTSVCAGSEEISGGDVSCGVPIEIKCQAPSALTTRLQRNSEGPGRGAVPLSKEGSQIGSQPL